MGGGEALKGGGGGKEEEEETALLSWALRLEALRPGGEWGEWGDATCVEKN